MVRLLTKKLLEGQRKRLLQPKRNRTSNITPEERKRRRALAEKKRGAVYNEIKEEWKRRNDVVEHLASKYNISITEMRRRLQQLPKYGPRRRVNVYNAVLHVRGLQLSEDLPEDERLKLAQIQEAVKGEDWRNLPKEELDEIVAILENKRDLEKKGINSQPKAVMRDVKEFATRTNEEIKALAARSNAGYCMLIARKSSTEGYQPVAIMDERSRDFFEVYFNIELDDLMIKYENYHILGIEGLTQVHSERVNMTRGLVRSHVVRGLREITGNKKALMEWKDYDEKIVEERHVRLENWPLATFGVESLGLADLNFLLRKFEKKEIYWRKLDEDEIEEHRRVLDEKRANGQVKKRKPRSDKGKKRPSYKKKEKKGNNEPAGDKPESSSGTRASRKKKGRPSKRPRAASILTSTGESSEPEEEPFHTDDDTSEEERSAFEEDEV